MDGKEVKLSLDADRGGYKKGDQIVYPKALPEGTNTFDLSAEAFAAACRGESRPVRFTRLHAVSVDLIQS
jgi:hypothetical protein